MKIFDGFKYNTTHGVLTAVARKDGGFDFDGGAYRVHADGTTYWMQPTPAMPTPFKVLGIFEDPIAPPLVAGAWYATDDGPKLCHAGCVVGSYKCTRDGMRNGERYALHKLENYQPAERTALIDNTWYTCSDGTTRCANKQFAGLFTMEEMGKPETAVEVNGFGVSNGAQFVIVEVSPPLLPAENPAPLLVLEHGKHYVCRDTCAYARVAFQIEGTENFSMEAGKSRVATVNKHGVCCETGMQFVQHVAAPVPAIPADGQAIPVAPQRAVCVMRVSATVEVQVSVDYYPDTPAAHIKEEAEKMARANLPKGVTVLEVQGLDIRL